MRPSAPFKRKRADSETVAAFGLGAALATGQAPLGWAWFALAALAVAMVLFGKCSTWRSAAWRGWALGSGHFAVALVWIVEPFMVDPVRHGWMAPFALLFMAGGLALFWSFAWGLAAWIGTSRRSRIAALVVTWTAAEFLRAHLLTGFPWAMPGHIWIGAPQMQIAALVGAHGLTLITLAAAAVPAFLGAQRAILGVILAAALMSLPVAYALMRIPSGSAILSEPSLTVRLIQPNAAQHEKWDPDLAWAFFERQLDFTSAPVAEGQNTPNVVIWPETAIPWVLEHADPAFERISLAAGEANVILGLQRIETGHWYNSLALLSSDGTLSDLYDKHHLVPFGEYIPLARFWARFGLFGLAANDNGGYVPGSGARLLELEGGKAFLPLICYEAIFPNDIARVEGRADWIVQITNDAWFGQISGPHQHLALARLRAVEQGLPLVRSANTGISAAFDPFGRELASIPLGVPGFVDVALPSALPSTSYARFGDLPILGFLFLSGAVLLLRQRRKVRVDRGA